MPEEQEGEVGFLYEYSELTKYPASFSEPRNVWGCVLRKWSTPLAQAFGYSKLFLFQKALTRQCLKIAKTT